MSYTETGIDFALDLTSKNGHGDYKNLTYNSKNKDDENTVFI